MNQLLHLKLTELVRTERKITGEILETINQIEARMIHLLLGFSSMFEYLTKGQGYSEGSAQRRLQSARLLKQTPKIAEKLRAGELNLTQVALVQTALRQQSKIKSVAADQKDHLLEKIEGQTQLETRRILQETFPKVKLNSERLAVRPKGKTIVSFEVSEEELKLIETAKALLSHSCPGQQTKDILLKLCEKLIKSKTTKNLKLKLDSNSELNPASVQAHDNRNRRQGISSDRLSKSSRHSNLFRPIEKSREPIPNGLRRDIFKKANQRCEYISSSSQIRCKSRYFLEIDHIKPVAFGGKGSAGNLRVLCREHNKLAAELAGLNKR